MIHLGYWILPFWFLLTVAFHAPAQPIEASEDEQTVVLAQDEPRSGDQAETPALLCAAPAPRDRELWLAPAPVPFLPCAVSLIEQRSLSPPLA